MSVLGHEEVRGTLGAISIGDVSKVNGDLNKGEIVVQYTVDELAPLGFGNPDANISYTKQKETGALGPEVEGFAVGLINSAACMAEVTEPDDGCMDGRGAVWAIVPNAQGGFEKRAINTGRRLRSKLAGGGYLTALAMKCALDSHIEKVGIELAEVADELTLQGIICGTHKGDHQSEGKTDCGANDNLEAIFKNGLDYYMQISNTIEAIYTKIGLPYDEITASRVNAGWVGTLEHEGYFEGSTGETRHEVIMKHISKIQQERGEEHPVAASKHLRGGHKEAFVVMNFCDGKTFSQADFRRKLLEQFPDMTEDGAPQVFVIDVSRIEYLANAMAKNREDQGTSFETALFAGVAYQFATAATLTDGSLRTFVVTDMA